MVASTRPPEALAPQAREIGPTVVPTSLQGALEADIVFLAVPFSNYQEVAKARSSWQGKTLVDVSNAFGGPVEELGGLQSSVAVARGLQGARLVKGFNHLGARWLGANPDIKGGRRVVFLSSDDEQAEEVANMIVYVCSEQSSATTGAALRVDGGVVRFVA